MNRVPPASIVLHFEPISLKSTFDIEVFFGGRFLYLKEIWKQAVYILWKEKKSLILFEIYCWQYRERALCAEREKKECL